MSLLRPGLHVVRRDDRHLQIGLDPPWRVVVPDDPGVQRVLDDLRAGREPHPRTAAEHRLLRDLRAADLLRPTPSSGGRVLLAGAPALCAEAARLLSDPVAVTGSAGDADVALVLAAGEPSRALLDDLLRGGVPHLVVGAGAGGYRVGPFVAPGRTACLRCVDAHHGEHDPRRAVVAEQLAGLPAAPDDLALEALAVAWAVRDVVAYLAGRRPTSWSATVELGDDRDPTPHPWRRHPWCGCAWDAVAAV